MPTATPTPVLLTPEDLKPAVDLAKGVLAQMDRVLLGRSELHRLVLAGVLSRGHILLEGLPGVGKTAMIKALGQILSLQFRRVQFTPDLMPSDILGAHILRESAGGGREMSFQPGPIFTNVLLADEINRASPKTQSALLEAMQERSVTLLGTTRPLPDPFFVLASQNPIELEGTYPLPEAQLDRFLFKLLVGDVSADVLDDIISTRRRGEPPLPVRAAGPDRAGRAVRRDGADLSAAGRFAVHRPAGRGEPSGQPGSDRRRRDLRHLRRQPAGGDRHGRGRAGPCPAGRPAHRRVRGRSGRCRSRDEPPADPQLQGAVRPGRRLDDHSRTPRLARRGRAGPARRRAGRKIEQGRSSMRRVRSCRSYLNRGAGRRAEQASRAREAMTILSPKSPDSNHKFGISKGAGFGRFLFRLLPWPRRADDGWRRRSLRGTTLALVFWLLAAAAGAVELGDVDINVLPPPNQDNRSGNAGTHHGYIGDSRLAAESLGQLSGRCTCTIRPRRPLTERVKA